MFKPKYIKYKNKINIMIGGMIQNEHNQYREPPTIPKIVGELKTPGEIAHERENRRNTICNSFISRFRNSNLNDFLLNLCKYMYNYIEQNNQIPTVENINLNISNIEDLVLYDKFITIFFDSLYTNNFDSLNNKHLTNKFNYKKFNREFVFREPDASILEKYPLGYSENIECLYFSKTKRQFIDCSLSFRIEMKNIELSPEKSIDSIVGNFYFIREHKEYFIKKFPYLLKYKIPYIDKHAILFGVNNSSNLAHCFVKNDDDNITDKIVDLLFARLEYELEGVKKIQELMRQQREK
jgi:hypothetical protein